MALKSIKVCFLGFLTITSCISQQLALDQKLKIRNEQKIGLPEATIIISNEDTTISLKTDLDGNLTITNLKAGTYQISVFAIGCLSLTNFPVKIKSNNTKIDIEMKQIEGLISGPVEWSGGWVTLEDRKGKIISIRSKLKK